MHKVVRAQAKEGYRIEIEFEDGLAGTISLEDRLFGPMFEPLRDPEYFARLKIDEFGVICWPNGADLAPDALHERLEGLVSIV